MTNQQTRERKSYHKQSFGAKASQEPWIQSELVDNLSGAQTRVNYANVLCAEVETVIFFFGNDLLNSINEPSR